jgi:hypothetical protein
MEPAKSLDRIYLTVLRRAVAAKYTKQQATEMVANLNSFLRTAAVLAAPLSRASIPSFSSITASALSKALHGLHSILDIPVNQYHPIQLRHATFWEFILNPGRCVDKRFFVDGKAYHKIVADMS